MKIYYSLVLLATAFVQPMCAFGEDEHHQHADHSSSHNHMMSASPLTAAGNYAFFTIQEAIEKLDADPNTDWSKVNLEALRQHLVDMQNFTLNVKVLSQKPLKNGMQAVVRPDNEDAAASLDRVFDAHPAQLKKETGWNMSVTKQDGLYTVTVTTNNPAEVAKIRGLGYIGAMATGAHHQSHHWSMAKGENPHQHH
ncbi:MAG: hypothetical protein PVF82_08685 [Gammaproteobacteria bacterium]|jgi:hypothetical protein